MVVNVPNVGVGGLGDTCLLYSDDGYNCITWQSEIDSSAITADTSSSTSSSSSGNTAADIAALVSAASKAATAASTVYSNATTPTVIKGTNLVYDPNTGSLIAASTTATTSLVSSSAIAMAGIVAAIGFVLVLAKGK